MGKEMLFQTLIDQQILDYRQLLVIANLPTPSTFVTKNFSYYKKIVDQKQRNVADVVFSDYFHSNDDLHDDGMFNVYVAQLKPIYQQLNQCQLHDNEMVIKLKDYLSDVLSYPFDFDYDNPDLNGWIIETLNHFDFLVHKIHGSVLNNLWNFLNHKTQKQYLAPEAHLKSLQDSLLFSIDMMPCIPKLNAHNGTEFEQECHLILDWIQEFGTEDQNWKAMQMLSEMSFHDYGMGNLGKISLLYREIQVWLFWYQYGLNPNSDPSYLSQAQSMQKDVGQFIYDLVQELHSKPYINLNK